MTGNQQLAVIGGTGAAELLEISEQFEVETAYGAPSSALARVLLNGRSLWFLARHGRPHHLAPHEVNYRANIDALRQLGVTEIVAINAVGGIDPRHRGSDLVLPDQLIDYTWGRDGTFCGQGGAALNHIEFAEPFTPSTRCRLLDAALRAGVAMHDGGCCAVTQGPRLETAAEVRRLARDGCTLVGMTTLPEAALAREASISYASLCVIANSAAGLGSEPISMEAIDRTLARGMGRVVQVLDALVASPAS